jgi:hypothetical protein
MELTLEIAFAVALAAVALSLVLVSFGRAPDRLLLGAAVTFAALAVGGAVAVGIDLTDDFADTGKLLLATGGVAAAALGEACLFVLARGLRRLREHERLGEAIRAQVQTVLTDDAENRRRELERTLARERANASYALGEQERQLAEERRDQVARQAERARVELSDAVASAQERLESRLRAWAADLDRGQRELESQLGELGQRQREALAAYDARLRADAERLAAVSEEQKQALVQLRAEFQRLAAGMLEEARSEIETHAAERRRALHEVSERLRTRERALGEQIEREQVDARARLTANVADVERRQLAQLERALERAANRLAEESERRFDAQIKASREKSAERLSRELDRSIDQFARRAESEVSDRIGELARMTADRMQRQVADVGRAAEAQHEVSAERLRAVSERLDQALAAAEDRIAAFEAQIELELETKLGALARSLRASQRE